MAKKQKKVRKSKKKSGFRRIVTVVVRTIETIVAFMIVVGGLVFWRLYKEPVQLESFLPKLAEQMIPAEAGLQVQADSVLLQTATDGPGVLAVSIRNLTVTREDGSVVTTLPEVEMSYGLWHILTLNMVPNTLVFEKPELQLIIAEDGRFYLQRETDAPPPASVRVKTKEQTLQTVDAVIRYLLSFDMLEMRAGSLTVDDRQKGEKLSIPTFNLTLGKAFGFNHDLQADASVLMEGDLMKTTVQARLNKLTKEMDFKITVDDVNLNRFGRVVSVLTGANLTVGGQISGSFDFSRSVATWNEYVEGGAFQVKVKAPGTLDLPAPLTNLYHVKSATINGAIGDGVRQIKIAQSDVVLSAGPVADVTVDVTGLDTFWKTGDFGGVQTVLKALVHDVPIALVPAVWPAALGPDAHAWVKRNLSEGNAKTADFTLYFTGAELVDLFGDIAVAGVRVNYVDGMKAVTDVDGQVLLYPDRVRILAKTGQIGNLKLTDADVDLTELTSDVAQAHIALAVTGPVREGMALIADKPLEFPQMFGIRPEQTGGEASVTVDLKFPLIESLDKNQVVADVKADITDGQFETPLPDGWVRNATVDLAVTNEKLTVNGVGDLSGIPIQFNWTEFFTPTADEVVSRYHVTGTLSDKQAAVFWASASDWMVGRAHIVADVVKKQNQHIMAKASVSFDEAEVFLYPISVTKEAGVPLAVNADVVYRSTESNGQAVFDMKGFADTAQQKPVVVQGQVDWGKDIVLNLSKVQAPGTDFTLLFQKDGQANIGLTMHGASWNISGLKGLPMGSQVDAEPAAQADKAGSIPNVQDVPPNVRLDVRLGSLVMKPDLPLQNVSVVGNRQGYFWQNLDISMTGNNPIRLSFNPQTKKMTASVPDLGDWLKRLGVSDRFIGGRLTLSGEQPARGGLVGTIQVKDFSFEDPGFFVQAVTILGIVDAIRGKNMHFKKAEIPFELTPYQTLYIKDGYAAGTNLGVTFKGRVRPDVLDLVGSVIPAYAINSLPGKIPLIGNLFKDGAGGGLMGVKYEMTGTPTAPKVTFNPLSSIAPGILGNLFQ